MAGDEIKSNVKSKAPSVKAFNCPFCGASVVIRAMGQSISVVCGSCGAIIDSSNENYRILNMASKKSGKREQMIPLGQRGKLRGVLWEVIGYVERTDKISKFTWSEYLLFNPACGFRWLTESEGHWNYVIMIKSQPQLDSSNSLGSYGRSVARYLHKEYFLFHRGSAKVSFVQGEFYWQLKLNETFEIEDYVSPPEILSCEKNENEIVWSLGEYIDADVVKTSFQISKPMPLQINVAPNQSSATTEAAKYSGKYWAIFASILFFIQFVSIFLAKSEVVYSGQFIYSSGDPNKLKVTPQFELKNGVSNLEVNVSAPIQNNWIEVQSDLINDEDGESQDFEQGIEYYYGTDSDGSWSEGGQTNSVVLSSIPNGKYHLNIEASGPGLYSALTSPAGRLSLNVVIKRNVVTWSNFFWALLLISILPALIFWRNRSFEMSRWSQSDHSPYPSYVEDEETEE